MLKSLILLKGGVAMHLKERIRIRLHPKDFYWLDKNYRDSLQNDMILEGVPALFEGDNCQIPSSLGIAGHKSRQSIGHPIPANTSDYHGHKT